VEVVSELIKIEINTYIGNNTLAHCKYITNMNKIYFELQLNRTSTKVTMQMFMVSKFFLEFGALFCQHLTG